jgi:hypothetical protein
MDKKEENCFVMKKQRGDANERNLVKKKNGELKKKK